MTPAKKRLEIFFKMPFKEIISDLHWNQKKSLKWLADQSNVCRKSITNICVKENISFRSHLESVGLTKNKGPSHWAYGKTKETSITHKNHSIRMKLKNPSASLDIRTKTAKTRAEYFKKNPWPQEIIMRDILSKIGVNFLFQYPIGPYIIDFFLPEINLCLEVDSTNKWGKDRRLMAVRKDEFLTENGFRIVRINKTIMKSEKAILNVLNCHNIIVQG